MIIRRCIHQCVCSYSKAIIIRTHKDILYWFNELLKITGPLTLNDEKHDIIPLPSIFNKSAPACPFLNIKPSNAGAAVVPSLLKYVLAPLSKNIRWLFVLLLSRIQLLTGNVEKPRIWQSCNVVLPTTFNVDTHVEALLKVDAPLTFNEDT